MLRRRFFAAMDVADIAEETADDAATPNARAVSAWYAVEERALERLAALVGRWPDRATLIWTEPLHGK